jgi:hypothetical protein
LCYKPGCGQRSLFFLALIAGTLAFGKFNGRPIIYLLFSALKFAWQPKFYLWQYSAPQQQMPVLHGSDQMERGSALKNLLAKL